MKVNSMRPVLTAAFLLALLPAALLYAEGPGDPDAEGCKDSTLLSRIPGCTILRCDSKEFDSADVPVSAIDPTSGERQQKTLEGEIESIEYICPTRVSRLQVARNTENALRAA